MNKTKSMPGPCCICGSTNYALSMGGPTICPKCDCGHFDAGTVLQQAKVIERLLAALKPFAEIASRLKWDQLRDDCRELDEHVIEAPAEDIAPGAAYCLMVSAFRNAALVSAKV